MAHGIPILLRLLAILGTAAMICVGGGILMHGHQTYGLSAPAHAAFKAASSAASYVPFAKGSVAWPVTAMASGAIGLTVGSLLILPMRFVLAPACQYLSGLWRQDARTRVAVESPSGRRSARLQEMRYGARQKTSQCRL
ncbi:DUF808 family protein [Methylobacterium sp. J-001]|nr:DUF808 family protein [Methylobacterium sp. J-001]